MTQESCVPTDSVNSGDYSSLVHSIENGAHIELDKTNLACLVGQSYEMQVW